jgi:hypothetical protein
MGVFMGASINPEVSVVYRVCMFDSEHSDEVWVGLCGLIMG